MSTVSTVLRTVEMNKLETSRYFSRKTIKLQLAGFEQGGAPRTGFVVVIPASSELDQQREMVSVFLSQAKGEEQRREEMSRHSAPLRSSHIIFLIFSSHPTLTR